MADAGRCNWSAANGRSSTVAGMRHEVAGEGVVGEQPVIQPDASFDYVSGCPLTTSTGHMEGRYHMVGADGSTFVVAIPRFPLVAPAVTS
jgi:ApaG protein